MAESFGGLVVGRDGGVVRPRARRRTLTSGHTDVVLRRCPQHFVPHMTVPKARLNSPGAGPTGRRVCDMPPARRSGKDRQLPIRAESDKS
ncbi:hypothetical protein GCM10010515_41550 [Streptomyces fructofermentans]|uniref:Uncharacterized protein n=1 Tax=Streptomyces fructofermentans TaxID=152141 RepID=A0A918KMU1_9ACTN|nr:hypothetical protein GCM10010515_41550 [Streptomyces fructofermentans]